MAVLSVLSLAGGPLASADELEDRRDRVRGNLREAHQHLDQSSEALMRTTRALDKAQHRLDAAQDRLSRTRGELAAAAAFDQRMQEELAAAITRLNEARQELADGRREVGRQEERLGQIAVQNYQSGDPSLVGLSMVLTSRDPAELTSQLNSVRTVLDKESVNLDRLRATKVLLTVQEKQVEKARDAVALKRRQAAENLDRKQQLEAKAEKAKAEVATLVAAREKARRAASAARAEDLRRLNQLQAERDEISALLAERAERARARALAAARAARAARSARAAEQAAGGFLSFPVDSYVTSEYGMRLHPIYKRYTLHDGTDFGGACGTPIRAAASGEVISMGFNTGYGNRVVIDHGFKRGVGLGTAYNHMNGFSTSVGERVSRGEVIGYVGNTGYSTGCHLHFMVFENGATVDPMSWL